MPAEEGTLSPRYPFGIAGNTSVGESVWEYLSFSLTNIELNLLCCCLVFDVHNANKGPDLFGCRLHGFLHTSHLVTNV